MKFLKLFMFGVVMFLGGSVMSQVSVNVNIGVPPPWGPVGYTEVRYYYLPDVEAYYDIQSAMFIYYVQGEWVHRAKLPSQYRSYDLYGGYKVVMTDYHGTAPYMNFKEHKIKYAKGYHGPEQRTYGEKPGKGNSGGKNYHEDNHGGKESDHGNGKSSGHGEGKGKKK